MIPAFDHNSVLPPHLGSPVNPRDLSPYHCTSIEIATAFATSRIRIELLKNLFNFRNGMRNAGLIVNCFQWIDGSFVEDKEKLLGKAPGDIDVLTFYFGYDKAQMQSVVSSFPPFNDRKLAKSHFSLDHIPIDLQNGPIFAYNAVRYYSMLFNHSRTGVWKGILLLDLNTQADDDAAVQFLNGL